MSASWHSAGVYAARLLDTPVGTPLMEILDHLTFGLAAGRRACEGILRVVLRIELICVAASWRVAGVEAGPPVTTRLPLAVHLTATSETWGGVTSPSLLFRVRQMASGLGRSSSVNFNCARSTTRLGLGGLEPAIAEYFLGGAVMGPLPRFAVAGAGCCFGGVDSLFWMLEIAWDSDLRVAWISSPGSGGMGTAVVAGAWLSSSMSFTIGSARKDFICGAMSDFLATGLYSLMRARSEAKVPFGSKSVGIFGMVAVWIVYLVHRSVL
jgi:hypothetical protein